MIAAIVALAIAVAVLCLLVAGLLRSHAAILRRLHELSGDDAGAGGHDRLTASQINVQPGIPRPSGDEGFPAARDIDGATLTEGAVHLRVADVPHDTLLAFLSSTCLTCGSFWETFADPTSYHLPDGTRLVVVTKSANEESPSALAKVAPGGVDLVLSSEAWAHYRVPGSPYFVSIEGATGKVRGEGTGLSWEQVAGLLAQATGDLRFTLGEAGARDRKPVSDAERELAVDRELMAAGIFPGDPRLYHEPGTGDLARDARAQAEAATTSADAPAPADARLAPAPPDARPSSNRETTTE